MNRFFITAPMAASCRARVTTRGSPTRQSTHAIKAMLDAKTREEFVAAVHAEDRLLVSGFYMVPFFDAGGQWVARLEHHWPARSTALTGFETTTLWRQQVSFTGAPPPARLNLARYCLAGKPAEKTALIVASRETQRWSYGALEDVVLRLAGGLARLGLEPGARLFIRMGNSLDYAFDVLCSQRRRGCSHCGFAHAHPAGSRHTRPVQWRAIHGVGRTAAASPTSRASPYSYPKRSPG